MGAAMNEEVITLALGDQEVELEVSPDAFQPTTTSRLLFQQVEIPRNGKLLDLGCGVGPIAIAAAKAGAREVYAVDIMHEACELARRNVERNGVADRVKVIQGDLFEPVKGERFAVIIDDVSGIAEKVARWSPWFPDTIPTGGTDGTLPTIRMLEEAQEYLAPGGSLYFPVLSLANAKKIFEVAKQIFSDGLELLVEKRVPLCPELISKLPELEKLREQGIVDFVTHRGRSLWTLQIFRARAGTS